MAKKTLTPEELKAKQEKKAAKSKVFFGTFTKALAVFLAIVVAWALVSISFTAPAVGGGSGVAANGGASNAPVEEGAAVEEENIIGDGSDSNEVVVENEDGTQTTVTLTKADVAKLFNDSTAKSAKGNYKWERKCWYTTPLDVGSATDGLNRIIRMVDKNASLDSVVGGFLGITGGENDAPWDAQVAGGKVPEGTKMKDKHLLKAFTLTEADILGMKVDGNTYTVQLTGVKSPQKDGKNSLHRVTDDFITLGEVAQGVKDGLGSLSNMVTINSLDVDFTSIVVTMVMENDAVKSVKISYTMTVNALNLKAGMDITGKGAGKMECSYTF